jgi:molybdopterin adenylyltransferase
MATPLPLLDEHQSQPDRILVLLNNICPVRFLRSLLFEQALQKPIGRPTVECTISGSSHATCTDGPRDQVRCRRQLSNFQLIPPRPSQTVVRMPHQVGGITLRCSVAVVTFKAKILTVSDSASRGERQDLSGDSVADTLARHGFEIAERRIVPDGVASVGTALAELSATFWGLVVTTGGTGFSPTDLTPEATRSVLDREAPGLAEAMHAASPLGRLSRGVAGTVGQCLVLNLPGSPKGAVETLDAVVDVIGHALDLMAGHRPH